MAIGADNLTFTDFFSDNRQALLQRLTNYKFLIGKVVKIHNPVGITLPAVGAGEGSKVGSPTNRPYEHRSLAGYARKHLTVFVPSDQHVFLLNS